jgi:CelD/BcsL family acetyltransferase involved in cellulose biosynthesis
VRGGALDLELLRDTAGLANLKHDWDTLWAAVADDQYELSHSVVWHAWTRVLKSQGHQLRIVVGRRAGQVVLIWPAILRQEKFQGIWRVVSWLGRDPIDYGAVLVAPEISTAECVVVTMKYLAAEAGADVLSFASVPADTRLYQELQQIDEEIQAFRQD